VIAIYIDPLVCHTWAGWFIPECYGVIVMVGCALTACVSAATVRSVRTLARR
jgi:hypothetical protein